MSKLFLKAVLRLIFVFVPTSLVVFVALYFVCQLLIAQGHGGILFVPGTIAIGAEILLYNSVLSPLIVQMARIRSSGGSSTSGGR